MQATALPICSVLVADDDTTLSGLWRELLSDAGYDVETASTGLKALDLMRNGKKVDVLLLDYNMPVLNGDATLGHVKEQFPNVKTIGVTGVELAQVPAAFREGVQKLLVKPFNESDLINAISSVAGVHAPAKAQTTAYKTNWVKFGVFYALFLLTSAGIFLVLRQAASQLLPPP